MTQVHPESNNTQIQNADNNDIELKKADAQEADDLANSATNLMQPADQSTGDYTTAKPNQQSAPDTNNGTHRDQPAAQPTDEKTRAEVPSELQYHEVDRQRSHSFHKI